MLRHKGFENAETLQSFVASTVPSDVYYSAAYYENPTAEMDKKGWLGADLVFDIDADHIPTPCNKAHDSWTCKTCGFADKGPSPAKCPHCGEARFDTEVWTCNSCLESAKEETVKLVDILMKDFGFASHETKVYFSGNRGYHVHVETEEVCMLDSMARKEIVDYIIGLGFDEKFHQLLHGSRIAVESDFGIAGWKERVTRGIYQFLAKATPNEAQAIGLSKHAVESMRTKRKMFLEDLTNQNWVSIKGVKTKDWKEIIKWIVEHQSAKIDTVVTTDVHRLIRLVGSLHGKTGFMKVEAPLGNLPDFDPLDAAIAFKEGYVVVDIAEAPEFRIGDTVYGPFSKAHNVELPTAAAIFLLCRGAAQAVEQ
jgi:DNA primase small subunit